MRMVLMAARAAATHERLKKTKMRASLAFAFEPCDLSPEPRESSVSRSFISSRSALRSNSRSRSAGLLRSLTPGLLRSLTPDHDHLGDLARCFDNVPLVSLHESARFAINIGSAAWLLLWNRIDSICVRL